jgi:hypothetical protein
MSKEQELTDYLNDIIIAITDIKTGHKTGQNYFYSVFSQSSLKQRSPHIFKVGKTPQL